MENKNIEDYQSWALLELLKKINIAGLQQPHSIGFVGACYRKIKPKDLAIHLFWPVMINNKFLEINVYQFKENFIINPKENNTDKEIEYTFDEMIKYLKNNFKQLILENIK